MLTWETVLDTTPGVTTKSAHIAEEPDSNIWEYFIDNDRASDRSALILMGDYSAPVWSAVAKHLTSQKVRRIGIKHFPQIGAIGFFTLLHEERSKILAPVHVKSKKYTAPSIVVTELDTTLQIVISPPIDYGADDNDDIFSDGSDIFDDGDDGTINSNIKYVCHRIILRLDQFAHEYITYENVIEVPKPQTTGTYDIYCVGYIHEGEAVSEDSNHVYLDIVGTQEDWPGPMEGSDLFITDVEITPENKVNIRRSDGFTKDSDNVIPVPIAATFLDNGMLQMTLSNGNVVTTDNSAPSSGGGGGGGSSYTPVNVYNTYYKIQRGAAAYTDSYTGKSGNLLLLSICTRGELTTEPVGWTKIGRLAEAGDNTADSSNVPYIQYVYFFYKISAGTTETINWEQSQTNMTILGILELENAGVPIIDENTRKENISTSTAMFTCTRNNTDMYVWFATAIYWTDGVYVWSVSDSNVWQLPNDGTNQPRLGIFVDKRIAPNPFTIGISLSGRYASCIGLRIPAKSSGGSGNSGGTTQFALNDYAVTSGDSGSVTSASCEVTSGDDSCTLLAIVTTRSTPTFSDGWEIVHQFEPTYYGTDSIKQTMTILKKSGSANTLTDSITVSVEASGRIYIVLLNLRGVKTVSADDSISNTSSSGGTSCEITKLNQKSIYAVQAISVSTPTLSINPNDKCVVIPCGYRLWVVVDISDVFTHTLTLSANSSGLQFNTIGLL